MTQKKKNDIAVLLDYAGNYKLYPQKWTRKF